MSSLALSCQGLHKAYGGVRAVHDVSFHVCSGEVVGLVGPNGAGKSTVVDLISGEQSADTGQVLVADRVLSRPRPGRPSGRSWRVPSSTRRSHTSSPRWRTC